MSKCIIASLIILLALPVCAGWQWELVDTVNSPVVWSNSEGYPSGFRMAYSPIHQQVIVNLLTDDEKCQTWGFDGHNWTYLDDAPVGLSMGGDMVFDYSQGIVYDFLITWDSYWVLQTIVSRFIPTIGWEEVGTLGGPVRAVTYDAQRQKMAMIVRDDQGAYFLGFFDGVAHDFIPMPDEILEADLIEYDQENDNLMIIDSNYLPWIYESNTFTQYNILFPDQPCYLWYNSIIYNPSLRGMVTMVAEGCTLLLQDYEWVLLTGMAENPYLLGNKPDSLVFFPPNSEVLFFTIDKITYEFLVYRLATDGHSKPFFKP